MEDALIISPMFLKAFNMFYWEQAALQLGRGPANWPVLMAENMVRRPTELRYLGIRSDNGELRSMVLESYIIHQELKVTLKYWVKPNPEVFGL